MSIPNLKVELALGSTMFSTSHSWTDVSPYVRSASTVRGRTSVDGRFQTGTATALLDNRTGLFTPENTASGYYPDVKVGVPVRMTRVVATETSTPFPVFYGSARAWPPDYPRSRDVTVQLSLADGFYTLNLEDLAGEEFPAQRTDERIDAVLDAVGWPAALRDIDTGVGTVQATSFALPNDGGEQSALVHLQDVAEAEVGALFMSADGKVTFRNRISTASPTPAIEFDDSIMSSLSTQYNDDYLWNVFKVAREDGLQVVYDVSGGAPRRTLIRDVMPMGNDSEVLNVAQWLAGQFGSQRLRVDQLTVKPLFDDSLFADVLGLELRDVVTVEHTPPAGDTIDQTCTVEQVAHSIMPGDWLVNLAVVPLTDGEQGPFFQLDVSELDGTDFLA